MTSETTQSDKFPVFSRVWLGLGALNGLISVAAGAYGRHGGLEAVPREMFAIASQYQITHGLVLLVTGLLAAWRPGGWTATVNLAGLAFALGVAFFSGSLYWFGLTGMLPFVGSAPTGGWLMMIGWLLLIWGAVRGFARSPGS